MVMLEVKFVKQIIMHRSFLVILSIVEINMICKLKTILHRTIIEQVTDTVYI